LSNDPAVPDAAELRAVLAAYRLVKDASWPGMHAPMAVRAAKWPTASAQELSAELAGYLQEASLPSCTVRVFWKLGPELQFRGCNLHFATDAGMEKPEDLFGMTDFSDRIPWQAQAAKYRFDDQEVVDKNLAKLDILERQRSVTGVVWIRVGKAPVRRDDGKVLGVLGMYQLIEPELAKKLFAERASRAR
jgi:hypothetical protein